MSVPVVTASITVESIIPGTASGVTITMGIDQPARADVVWYRSTDKVQKPLGPEMISRMAASQAARLKARTSPDTTLTLTDSQGNTLTFKGYAVAPAISETVSNTQERLAIIGVDSVIADLNLSIYGSLPNFIRDEMDPESKYLKTPVIESGNVTQMFADITDALVGNLAVSINDTDSSTFRQVITLRDQVNQQAALPAWKAILSNSDATYTSWPPFLKAYPVQSFCLSQRALEDMQQNAKTFWGVMGALMNDFMLYYVPDTETNGKLVRRDQKTLGPTEDGDISVTTAYITDGSTALQPITGVVVQGPPRGGLRVEGNLFGDRGVVTGNYPAQLTAGSIIDMPPPPWMIAAGGVMPVSDPEVNLSDGDNPDLSLETYQGEVTALTQDWSKAEGVYGKALSEYAQVIFQESQLADSVAQLSGPLNLALKCGKRYRFKQKDGSLFTGFVYSLVHQLQLEEGREVTQLTNIGVSHVTFK